MKIIIDGKPAMIKTGSSFEMIAENRLFSCRDTFTLTITFPLAECAQNRDIFGYIDRKDAEKKKVFFDCEIRDTNFHSVGTIIVTNISESEVKCQYAEGRCEQNATDPFEKVYVNELDLGMSPSTGSYTPQQAWQGIDSGASEVALPWINESYPTQFNNWVVYVNGGYKWASTSDSTSTSSRAESATETLSALSLSWQPYLIVIAKRICDAVGYSYDFSEWENSGYRHLLICNTLPSGWTSSYKDVMPNWTVTEFFEKLEMLMMCEFNFDHKAKFVSFEFTKSALENIEPVLIEDIVDAYDVELSTDEQNCEYLGTKRRAYADGGHNMQPYYACDWFMQNVTPYVYADVNEMIEKTKKRVGQSGAYPVVYYGEEMVIEGVRGRNKTTNADGVYYAEAEDTYFVLRSIGRYLLYTDTFGYHRYAQICVLQPINLFGSGSVESDNDNTEEIEFVPVCVTDTYIDETDDQGYMMLLSFSGSESEASDVERTDLSDKDYGNKIVQYSSASIIESGEREKQSERYSLINVGFWNGTVPNVGKSPYPLLDRVNVSQDWTTFSCDFPSLRLTSEAHDLKSQMPQVDPKKKYKFSFVSSYIPNPRAIYYIRGKRYICEKITATFTEDGMSQLLKGHFYQIIED